MGIHLLLADARHIYRSGLRAIFSSEPDVASIAEAISYEALKSKLATLPFDLVLVHQSLVTDISVLPRDRFVLLVSEPNRDLLRAACS
jgi:DNA-binding NarL/FixJ family response regulator